jgi:hypothetical protein
MTLANGFVTADNAEKSTATNIIIHSEISAIEGKILVESGKGFMSVIVNDSLMTNNTLNTSVSVSSVSVMNNTITLSGTDVETGTPVIFSSTNTLPSPLTTNTIYYLVATNTINVYKLSDSKQNSMQTSPIVLTIADTGTGTHSAIIQTQSQLYYNAWTEYTYSPENKAYSVQMNNVISYFTNLGYSITRRQGTNSLGALSNIFYWYITW